jgi:hypothetical protein
VTNLAVHEHENKIANLSTFWGISSFIHKQHRSIYFSSFLPFFPVVVVGTTTIPIFLMMMEVRFVGN